jgi:hypothetical protein
MNERFARTLDFFRLRKREYQHTFTSLAGQEVFRDLALFCRANETCTVLDKDGRVDDKLTFMMEGRREVYLRILIHMGLTPQQLMVLFTGGTLKAGDTNG